MMQWNRTLPDAEHAEIRSRPGLRIYIPSQTFVPEIKNVEKAYETFGNYIDTLFDPFSNPSEGFNVEEAPRVVSQAARNELLELENDEMVSIANKLLDSLDQYVDNLQLEMVPSLRAVIGEDGSLLLSWSIPHFRLGISIETHIKESGWYIVSDGHAGNINASGYLAGVNLDYLLGLFLFIIVEHQSLLK